MNAKLISVTITFAAVAIALNTIRIPTIFYPGNYFQFSQIPIVVAFLLFGARMGISVGILNLVVSIAILPVGRTGILTHTMDFLSLLPMFAGLILAKRGTFRNHKTEKSPAKDRSITRLTGLALLFRVMTMPLIDYGFVFHFALPLFFGIKFSGAAIAALVPSFVLYNALVPLYTVPVAYVVATKVSGYLRKEARLLDMTRNDLAHLRD